MFVRKVKVSSIILSMVFALMVGLGTTSVHAIEPRGTMAYCSNCGDYTSHMYKTTREFAHNESFKCEHGTHKYDIYQVYEVTTTTTCNYCGYKSSATTADHVFLKCSNTIIY